jgi:hypothetical protein
MISSSLSMIGLYKRNRATLLKKPYARTARKIIIQLAQAPFNPARLADAALKKVNATLVDHNDITHPPFLLSRVTPSHALVLTTGFEVEAKNYEPYLSIIMDTLKDTKPVAARINER